MRVPWLHEVVILLTALGIAGCPTPEATPDAALDAFCSLTVEVGPSAVPFAPFEAGAPAQIVLGFQGFQMLVLDIRIAGSATTRADLTASIELVDSAITASHADRGIPTSAHGDGVLVSGFFVFFNDAPLAEIQGRDADLTIIARAGGCVGGTRVRLRLSEEAPCIDPTTMIPDVAARDAGPLPDGAILCEAP